MSRSGSNRNVVSQTGPQDDKRCPLCYQETLYNPNLRFCRSSCGHQICESCFKSKFAIEKTIPCPICKIPLTKDSFRSGHKADVDPDVERDVMRRKEIMEIYNKTLENFNGDLKAYNDYLEEVEDLIYELCNNIDIEKNHQKIKDYKRDNFNLIHENQSKKYAANSLVEQEIERQKKEAEDLRQKSLTQQVETRKQELEDQQQLLEALAQGTISAEELKIREERKKKELQEKEKETYKPTYVPSAPKMLANFLPMQKKTSQSLPPNPQNEKDAGGWKSEWATLRNLEEAFCF